MERHTTPQLLYSLCSVVLRNEHNYVISVEVDIEKELFIGFGHALFVHLEMVPKYFTRINK
jgi:hypothetical protein